MKDASGDGGEGTRFKDICKCPWIESNAKAGNIFANVSGRDLK